MLKANRVGTPHIWQPTTTSSAANIGTTLNAAANNFAAVTSRCNVITTTPLDKVGYNALTWSNTGSAAETADCWFGLCQELTIQKPDRGNTVGIELEGHAEFYGNAILSATPIFGAVATTSGALFSTRDFTNTPIQLECEPVQTVFSATRGWTHIKWKTQALVYQPQGFEALAYCHGVKFGLPGITALTLYDIKMHTAFRTLDAYESMETYDPLR